MSFAELTAEFLARMERGLEAEEKRYSALAAEVRSMSTAEMLQSKGGDQSLKRAQAVKFAEDCHAAAALLNQFDHQTYEALGRLQQARYALQTESTKVLSSDGSAGLPPRAKLLSRLHDMQADLLTANMQHYQVPDADHRLQELIAQSGHPRVMELRPQAAAAGMQYAAAFGQFAALEQRLNFFVNQMAKVG